MDADLIDGQFETKESAFLTAFYGKPAYQAVPHVKGFKERSYYAVWYTDKYGNRVRREESDAVLEQRRQDARDLAAQERRDREYEAGQVDQRVHIQRC
jgi:hypothetical protein